MTKKFNPFKPHSPVYRGMFVGRKQEIDKIDKALYQTKMGNPCHVLIAGERGIGKSSLLLVANHLAKGDNSWDGEKYNFLTIQLSIDEHTSIVDFARKINVAVKRELNKSEKEIAFAQKAWDFLKKFEASGFKYKDAKNESTDSEIIDNIAYSLVDTVKSLTEPSLLCEAGLREPKDGLVILIDEADNSPDELKLGACLKTLSEVLVREDCNKVLFILAGLPVLSNVLYRSHESSLRLFEERALARLTPTNVKEIINRGLQEILKHSNVEIKVDDDALDDIVTFSEGYPHFIQQIGFSVISIDTDNLIKRSDVTQAMFMDGGALACIGDRYYKNMFYERIKEDSYRDILTIMSKQGDGWVTKQTIASEFSGKESSLTNGLKALRDRNIILSRKGVRGQYRLQWMGFALWIRINAGKT